MSQNIDKNEEKITNDPLTVVSMNLFSESYAKIMTAHFILVMNH